MDQKRSFQEETTEDKIYGDYRMLTKEDLVRSVDKLDFSYKFESENFNLKIRKYVYLTSMRRRKSKFEAAEKRYLLRIELLEQEVQELKCENENLKKLLCNEEGGLSREFCKKMPDFNKFFRGEKSENLFLTLAYLNKSSLLFKPQAISDSLLLQADTIEGVTEILRKKIFLKNQAFFRSSTFFDARVSNLLAQYHNIRHIFTSKEQIKDLKFAHVLVNGKNMLKKFSDIGLVYVNSEISFKEAKIICCHVDGKFSNCPKGYAQSFLMRLRVQRKEKVTIETFAFALLKGKSQTHYEEFFRIVKANHCPNFPILVCDFELAIANAVKEVLPKVEIRGCYFHFQQNLHRKKRQIERWTMQKVSDLAMRVLSLTPFFRRPSSYILKLISSLELRDEALFHHPDFKIANYVHRVYCMRLKQIFQQDLKRLIVRTNNTCEGFNSTLNKRLHQKGRVQDYVNFFEISFKKDLVYPNLVNTEMTSFDFFLLEIQAKSATNFEKIFDFCRTCPAIVASNGRALLKGLEKSPLIMKGRFSITEDEAAKEKLEDLGRNYRLFSHKRREDFYRLQKHGLHFVLSGLDVENLKEIHTVDNDHRTNDCLESRDKGKQSLFDLEDDDQFIPEAEKELLAEQSQLEESRIVLEIPSSIPDQAPTIPQVSPKELFCFRPLRGTKSLRESKEEQPTRTSAERTQT